MVHPVSKYMLPIRISKPVIMACDAGYSMPLATALRSIVETNRSSWPLEFHVLSDGFSEATKRKVLDSLPKLSASIRWIPINVGLFQRFWTREDVSKMTYARLLIPQVFPDTVSRVLYLDTDVLVLDDLGPLWETDLEGAVLGAVLDGLDPQIKSGRPGLEQAPRVQNYFNAGVLLIDLDRWRKEQVSKKTLNYMNQHPQTPFMDQDALNVVCNGRWKRLNPRWNFHVHERSLSNLSLSNRPGIAHFVNFRKPWDISILSVNACFYDDFRSRTRFARTPWDRLRDGIQRFWIHLNIALRRSAFLRAVWHRIRPLRQMKIVLAQGKALLTDLKNPR